MDMAESSQKNHLSQRYLFIQHNSVVTGYPSKPEKIAINF